ncbi:hypothetical protein HDU96_004447 [Phlyctochytrium bullatum]|nr:hypothetical protein HDU96_004447 [Phlyctochytrium bullatum]
MNPVSAVIATLKFSIQLANEVRYARHVSNLLVQQLQNTCNILETLDQARRRDLARMPEINQLVVISAEIRLFLQEANTSVQLFRIVFGQYRVKAEELDQKLSRAMSSLNLNLTVLSTVSRNRAIEEDVREADREISANPTYTRVRDTYNQTRANANVVQIRSGELDKIIQAFFTRRNYIMALGPLFNYYQWGTEAEKKKAALFLGHCYRFWAASATNEIEAKTQRESSVHYYSAAFDLGSSTAAVYLAQYCTSMGNAETANLYLERYMLSQEPDRTMFS